MQGRLEGTGAVCGSLSLKSVSFTGVVCEHLASHLAHLHLPCTYLLLRREQLGAGGDGVLGALPTIHTSVAEGGALKQLRPALDTLAGEGRRRAGLTPQYVVLIRC